MGVLGKLLFWSFFAWFIYSVIQGIVYARKNQGVIFIDFTDAAFSLGVFIAPFTIGFILNNIFQPDPSGVGQYIIKLIVLTIFLVVGFYVVMNTYYSNNEDIFKTALISTAKIGLSLLLIFLVFSGGSSSSRREDESLYRYERRKEENHAFHLILIASIGSLIGYLINEYRFSTVSLYLNFKDRVIIPEGEIKSE
ncbi:MAG: hypothetical protein C4518_03775 [Desulfobacteraceae bacterium]|nr:MAG: hypothetical protein C4518_03775 [Desulfobacteraceae bacterium]